MSFNGETLMILVRQIFFQSFPNRLLAFLYFIIDATSFAVKEQHKFNPVDQLL